MIVDIVVVTLEITDWIAHILSSGVLIRIQDRSSWQVIHNPVVMVLLLNGVLESSSILTFDTDLTEDLTVLLI